MESTATILAKVVEYLEERISLQDLEDWLVPRLGWFADLPPCTPKELAGEIDLGLAEMSMGHLTDDELRERLREFVQAHPNIFVHFGDTLIRTESANSKAELRFAFSSPVAPKLSARILPATAS